MEFSEILNRYLKDNKMTLREFADKSGLSFSYINKLRNFEKNNGVSISPTLNTVVCVAKAMDMSLIDLAKMLEDE